MNPQTMPLEKWMRIALFATAAMNMLGAITFFPAVTAIRLRSKLPEAHPLYLWLISIWIFAFGIGYFWMALKNRRDRIFIAVGAAGKLSFFGLLAAYTAAGELPSSTVAACIGDLIFGIIFIVWLFRSSDE